MSRRSLYYRLFGADGELARCLDGAQGVLDLGCSDGRGSELLTGAAGCDIYRPALERAVSSGRRRTPVIADLRDLPYADDSFDAVVALDVIEHFEKSEALIVLAEMGRVARRVVAVMTPSGFVAQAPGEDEPWQEHRCGFEPEELRALGFDVVGVGGARGLRSAYGAFRGGFAGQAAAVVSNRWLRSRPEQTFHVFAERRVGSPAHASTVGSRTRNRVHP